MQNVTRIDLDEAIQRIRKALKERSGKAWSVKRDRGTSYGWITIESPPSRCDEHGYMPESDRTELAKLLGLEVVHHQGESIPSGGDYRQEYVDRAEGRPPAKIGKQYWD
jgi:hypothetical protein